MNSDDLLKEMERVATAFAAPDQMLELDIQTGINALRNRKAPVEAVEAFDRLVHNPQVLEWTVFPLPETEDDFVPNQVQIDFIKRMIEGAGSETTIWEVPTTGQVYEIDRKSKAFKLIRNTDRDENDWHAKNTKILKMLGWKMIDYKSTARMFVADKDGWRFTLSDFSIEDQYNSATGKFFPPGSRGVSGMAAYVPQPIFLPIGVSLARAMIAAAGPQEGLGKSTAAGTSLTE